MMNVKSAIGVRPRSYILLKAAGHAALIALGTLSKLKNLQGVRWNCGA